MKDNNIDEYIVQLERLLSFAYANQYSLGMLERAISRSPYFQDIEREDEGISPSMNEYTLIGQVFGDKKTDLMDVETYKACSWAAEAYMRIQKETRLTFEAIFLYIPIRKMYDYFYLYHEMDFTQIIKEFKRIHSEKSIFSILLSKYGYKLKYVSEELDIPYSSLFSYKQRNRDIKKMNVDHACSLAAIFHVRVETLVELTM